MDDGAEGNCTEGKEGEEEGERAGKSADEEEDDDHDVTEKGEEERGRK